MDGSVKTPLGYRTSFLLVQVECNANDPSPISESLTSFCGYVHTSLHHSVLVQA